MSFTDSITKKVNAIRIDYVIDYVIQKLNKWRFLKSSSEPRKENRTAQESDILIPIWIILGRCFLNQFEMEPRESFFNPLIDVQISDVTCMIHAQTQ